MLFAILCYGICLIANLEMYFQLNFASDELIKSYLFAISVSIPLLLAFLIFHSIRFHSILWKIPFEIQLFNNRPIECYFVTHTKTTTTAACCIAGYKLLQLQY